MSDKFTGYAYSLEQIDKIRAMAVPMQYGLGDVDIKNILDINTIRELLRIESQAAMNSCRGHSMSTGIEVINYHETGEWVQISRLFCYLITQLKDGLLGRDAGSTIYNGLIQAKELGVILESEMPYPNPVRYPGKAWFLNMLQTPEIKNALRFFVGNFIETNSYEDALVFYASELGYQDIGMSWPPVLDENYVCTDFRRHGRGMHAVCGVGTNVELSRAYNSDRPLIAIANSHDDNFGDNGYFYMTENAFNQMLNTRFNIAFGVTGKGPIKPKRANIKTELSL